MTKSRQHEQYIAALDQMYTDAALYSKDIERMLEDGPNGSYRDALILKKCLCIVKGELARRTLSRVDTVLDEKEREENNET